LDQRSKTRSSSSEVGLVPLREVTRDLGEGVGDRDVVDLLVDSTGLEVEREQLTLDLDTLSMGMSVDFRVAVKEDAHPVRISRTIIGRLA
jgi:hypothetical protein